ncbi:hypothetical protein ACGFX4_24405 [Kitasatospora sp. NPDC048365]|uniref:hypothetical protein n=1 Tax=Kitasatospora sp. NPDC048365 TaxID=3364050 RepID=UPI0037187B8D
MGHVDEQSTPKTDRDGAPAPEPIRWFGTSWVEHGTDYWLRRVAVALGALIATVAGAFLLRFAVQGVQMSDAGSLVDALLIGGIAVCSAMAGLRNWKILTEGRQSLSGWTADRSLGAVWAIGFVGALAAYFLRSLVEAPGEGLQRAVHDQATATWERRRSARNGRSGGKKRRS